MPPVPPERDNRGGVAPPPPGNDKDRAPCSYCIGVSAYTRAMWQQHQEPTCKGVLIDYSMSRERLQELKDRAPPPRQDDFTFLGVGVSVYSCEWMEEGKHLPSVKGLGVIAVHTDNDELMKRIEERKRIKRELQKNAGERGDLEDGDDRELDDGAVEDDGTVEDDGQALVESEVVPSMKKPRLPPVVPDHISLKELRQRAAESVTHSVKAMYTFWARRMDGFSDRYVDSCRRLTEQMDKQARSAPQSVTWLLHKAMDEYARGKGDDK